MCTLALYFKVFADAPVLLLSNRDELSDRPWTPPALLSSIPRTYGPRDTQAGGTWLGVNEAGLVVTITNHLGTLAKGSSFCSRGYVVAEALRHETAREAKNLVALLSPACKAFTLLAVDKDEAFIVDNPGDRPQRVFELSPGLHAVTNSRFGEENDVKAKRLLRRMEELRGRGAIGPEEARWLLADHEEDAGQINALCVHPPEGSKFGTVSSALVEVTATGKTRRFLFAGGRPCEATFIDATPEF